MRQSNHEKRALNVVGVFGICMLLVVSLGVPPQVLATEQNEVMIEGEQEDQISSRGIRGKKPKSSISRSRVMKKTLPSRQPSSTTSHEQIQALQRQVSALQAQVNALRAVIQVSNNVMTVQSKVIRLQGETVVVKSVKEGVTIESRKNLKLESKKDVTMKANSKLQIDAGSTLNMKGNGMTSIRGAMIKLNNGKKPVASLGSNTLSGPGGPGKITSGSPTVMVP